MIVRCLLLFSSAGIFTFAAAAQSVPTHFLSPTQVPALGQEFGNISLDRATNDAIAILLKNQPSQGRTLEIPNSAMNMPANPGQCAEPLLLAKVPQDVDSSMPKLKAEGKLDSMNVKPMPVCRR
ncbi:MAG TPA: hypothetical protein VH351_07075 [Bryobacteraceae bacterium]|jgi:hypothetical protein|nr:hypothetical protein [Bryobacteraceae bacterium]